MGPILGRQDPDGPDVGPINFALWDFGVFSVDDQFPYEYMHPFDTV